MPGWGEILSELNDVMDPETGAVNIDVVRDKYIAKLVALTGRPLVVHEQNSIAGLANRMLAKIARRVVCGFPGALSKSGVTQCATFARRRKRRLGKPLRWRTGTSVT